MLAICDNSSQSVVLECVLTISQWFPMWFEINLYDPVCVMELLKILPFQPEDDDIPCF